MMILVSSVSVADLNIKEEGGGGGEEPGAQGEASKVALDGQALPPMAKNKGRHKKLLFFTFSKKKMRPAPSPFFDHLSFFW